METISGSPSKEHGPAIRLRRYGHNDFEKFDEENARGSHIRMGSASIGKVDVDCRYHWKKAQWGVLGNPERPAGIVYMDITFKQPQGYWLRSASVFVTLSQPIEAKKSSWHRPFAKSLPHRSLESDYAVQITQQYGPKHLTGTKTVQSETKTNSVVPTVGAGGIVEFGGVGQHSTTAKKRSGQWEFKGIMSRPRGPHDYCTLEWGLTENELDPGQVHRREYNTAFAFEHSERPIIMRVEVQGKLQTRGRQFKHMLHKSFSSSLGRSENSTLMHLDLSKTTTMKENLDDIAEGLEMSMQWENYRNTPIIVPEPNQAQFYAARDGNSPGEENSNDISDSSRITQHQYNDRHASQEHETHALGIETSQQHHMLLQETKDQHCLELLREALRLRQGTQSQHRPAFTQPRDTISTKEDDSGYSSQAPNKSLGDKRAEEPPLPVTVLSNTPLPPTQVQLETSEQTLEEISEVPAILILFNILATIARWLSKLQTAQKSISPSEAEKEPQKQNDLRSMRGSGSSTGSEAPGNSVNLAWGKPPPPAPNPPNSNVSHKVFADGIFQRQQRVSSQVNRRQMRDRY